MLTEEIKRIAKNLSKVKLMHVCGTHEQEITRHGLRHLLPKNVEVVAGPGCPVCVTPKIDIDKIIYLALNGVTVTTYGDMFNVPSNKSSLRDAKSLGADVRIVYSINNAIEIAFREREKKIVHFGIGFETTAPTTSVSLMNAPENFFIYSSHRLIPPALLFLLKQGTEISGLIEPGHVSVIIGAKAYESISEKFGVPQVVTGFGAMDILEGILMLLKQISEGRGEVENQYRRAVRWDGNKIAQNMMKKTFEVVDAEWRGLGVIPESGLEIKDEFSNHDAKKNFDFSGFEYIDTRDKGCRCGEVLRGLIKAWDCPLFAKVCTPENPVGPCMISREGSCNIRYKYGENWEK